MEKGELAMAQHKKWSKGWRKRNGVITKEKIVKI